MAHIFHSSLLRAYDMRGVMGEMLGEADAYAVGRSFATWVRRTGGQRVAVGYDGRISSPMLAKALLKGLRDSGVDTVEIGAGPTPMLYYAEATQQVDGGIEITGSHNPRDHNGFKLVLRRRPVFGADIERLAAMAAAGDWLEGEGRSLPCDIMAAYVDRLVEGFQLAPFRIGWDAGNGAAGPVVEALVERLPGEHHLLFTDMDGNFPNHHPDPARADNLADLQALVRDRRLDFGVAFDGDGDRLGVVDGQGRIIWGDQLLALFATDMLRLRPAATIIGDVKTSQAVFDRIAQSGGVPMIAPTGHSLIKARMQDTGALLAGDISGHFFFADLYHGYDDGLYAAVRLIDLLGRSRTTLAKLRDDLPICASTPDIRIPVAEADKRRLVEMVRAGLVEENCSFTEVDGVRVFDEDGWWLLRASNTEAALTLRAEAADESGLARLIDALSARLASVGVILPEKAAW